MVCFAKVILNIVVFGGYAELDKFVFKCAALLKKAMDFSADVHFSNPSINLVAVTATWAASSLKFSLFSLSLTP